MKTDVILRAFGGDIASFNAFVCGDANGLAAPCVRQLVKSNQLGALVDLVIDEFGDPTAAARQGLARTVTLLLIDQIAGIQDPYLAGELGYRTERSFKEAVWRARRRASSEPFVSALTSRALKLVA